MPTIRRRKYDPSNISNVAEGRFPLKLIRLCLIELYGLLDSAGLIADSGTGASGGGGGGSGGGTGLGFTTIYVDWVANGPFRVDEQVDGAWLVKRDCSITGLSLWRGVSGSSGSTVLDLKRLSSGASDAQSLYATTANRPTIRYSDGDDAALDCVLPDTVSLVAGDLVWPDTLAKEGGLPQHWRLSLEAA